MSLNKFVAGTFLALSSAVVLAGPPKDCPVTYDQLKSALDAAQAQANGGLGFDMWGTVVNKDGSVCAVAKTGAALNDQWLASRVISAQKAYTAATLNNNATGASSFADGFAFSTASLYDAVQAGGPLFGLQFSNPVDPFLAYAGSSAKFGTKNDPMVGKRVGGINVFGGGLTLFDKDGQVVGAVGVSGDTSCADHNIARRVRGSFAHDKIAQGTSHEADINYATYPDCNGSGDNTDEAAFYNGTIKNIGQLFANYP